MWWVFNDIGNVKTETNSGPIGLEIRAQAYSYNAAATLDVTTFYNYQIINRSSNDLDSAYIGFWVDGDLGNAVDDYIGCDAFRDLGYFYNADADDDGSSGYGTLPPAIGIDFTKRTHCRSK